MSISRPKWREYSLRAPQYIHDQEHTGHSMTLCGQIIWFLGGLQNRRTTCAALYALDLNRQKWSRVMFPRSLLDGEVFSLFGQSGTLIDSRIVFIGGYYGINQSVCRSTVFSFDVVLGEFAYIDTVGPEQRGGIAFHRAHFLYETDEIVVYGGQSGHGLYPEDPFFSLNARTFTWSKLRWVGSAPKPRCNHGSCLIERKVYMFGGIGPNNVVYDDMFLLDLTHGIPKFSEVKLGWIPRRRFGTELFHYRGQIYMFGGKAAFSGDMSIRLHNISRFSILKQEWYECETFNGKNHPRRSGNHRGLLVNKKALIFGGTNASLRKVLEIAFE